MTNMLTRLLKRNSVPNSVKSNQPPESIDKIIERSGLIVFDYDEQRGYGLNRQLSRVPQGIDWHRFMFFTSDHKLPNVLPLEKLYSPRNGRWLERKEANGRLEKSDGIGEDSFGYKCALIHHGKANGCYIVSYQLISSKSDRLGKGGSIFKYVLLLDEADYDLVMEFLNQHPAKINETFRAVAPQHYDAKMPDRHNGVIALFPLWDQKYLR